MSARLESVGYAVGDAWLLRGASLEVRPGELTCVVGPNGAGKSTLLRLLCGLLPPTEGRALLGDARPDQLERREVARRVAFVPQRARLAPDFTVEELVRMGRYPHEERWSWWRAPEPTDGLERALARADLLGLRGRLADGLSGGEVQRVQLARALLTDAPALVLDEPTANLDPAHALAVMHLARELAREGKGVAMALHDLNAAAAFADQVALLSAGRVVACGPPADVLTAERVGEVFAVEVEVAQAGGRRLLVFHRRVGP